MSKNGSMHVRLRPVDTGREGSCKKWHAPRWDFLEINMGASFLFNSMEIGIGMIVHDNEGRFLLCRTMVRSGLMQIDDGEAWGVEEALHWAYSLGFERVHVETDSKRVAGWRMLSKWRMQVLLLLGTSSCQGRNTLMTGLIFL